DHHRAPAPGHLARGRAAQARVIALGVIAIGARSRRLRWLRLRGKLSAPRPRSPTMPRPRILVTRRWPEAVERRLCELFDTTLNTDDQRLSADELRAALRDFDAVLPTVSDRLDASVLS